MTHFVGGNLTNNIPAWEQLLKKCGGFHHVLDWVKFGIKIQYAAMSYLGWGTFGCVVKAMDVVSGKLVAVKKKMFALGSSADKQ